MNSDYVIGIVTYLPQENSLRDKRFKYHLKQLKIICEMFPDTRIIEINQNYTNFELNQVDALSKNIYHIVHDQGIGLVDARNELLDQLYSSNYKYMLMLDDDVAFYPYYDSKYFMEDLCNFEKIVGLVRPLIPLISPFKKLNYKEKEIIENHWILTHTKSFTPWGVFVVSNLERHFEKKLYFKHIEEINSNYEDYEFVFQFMKNHIPTYICRQLIAKNVGNDNNSTIFVSEEERKARHIKNLTAIYDSYRDIGVRYSVTDGKIRTNLSKLPSDRTLCVPRSNKYEFTPNLIVPIKSTEKEKKKLL